MWKIVFLVITVLLIVIGCSSQTFEPEPIIKQEKQQQSVIQENRVDAQSLEVELNRITVNQIESNIREIDFKLSKNYSVAFADLIGNNLILSIMDYKDTVNSMGDKGHTPYLSLVKYNLQSQTNEIIYQGETYTDTFNSRLKVLQNGTIAFFASTKVLLLDKENLRLTWEIDLPERSYFHYDISPDGKKIVLNNFDDNGNLSITDWKFKEWKSLVNVIKGSDPNGMDGKSPGSPLWSNDGKQISYVMFLYESSKGIGVVGVDGNNNHFFAKESPHFIPSYTYWVDNDKSILAVQVGSESQAYVISLSDGSFNKLEIQGSLNYLIPNPVEPKAAYIADNQVYVLDLEVNKSEIVTPIQDWVSGIQWDDSGKELIILRDNKVRIITP